MAKKRKTRKANPILHRFTILKSADGYRIAWKDGRQAGPYSTVQQAMDAAARAGRGTWANPTVYDSAGKAVGKFKRKAAKIVARLMGGTVGKPKPMTNPRTMRFKTKAAMMNYAAAHGYRLQSLRKRNVAMGFYDATGFHPLRSSPDYDPDRAGDDYSDTPKRKRKAKTKRRGKSKR